MARVTVTDVRIWLRDVPDKNPLLDSIDFDAEEVDSAIDMVIDDFNTTPVFTRYSKIAFPYRALLLNGVAWWLLSGEAVRQARNHLSYSSGGVQVDDMDRAATYSNLALQFKQIYDTQKRDIKNHENLSAGWGNIVSDYSRLPND